MLVSRCIETSPHSQHLLNIQLVAAAMRASTSVFCGKFYVLSSLNAREIPSPIVSRTISHPSALSNLQMVLWFAGSSSRVSMFPGRLRDADDLSTIFEKWC